MEYDENPASSIVSEKGREGGDGGADVDEVS